MEKREETVLSDALTTSPVLEKSVLKAEGHHEGVIVEGDIIYFMQARNMAYRKWPVFREPTFVEYFRTGDVKILPPELQRNMEAMDEKLWAEEAEKTVANLVTDRHGRLRFNDFERFVEGDDKKDKVNDLKDAFKMYEMDGGFVLSDPHEIFEVVRGWMIRRNLKENKETNVLPLSRKDLKNIALEQKALNSNHFLRFALGSMLDISPQQHGILLMLFGGILSYLAKNSTTPFEFQVGKTTYTPESLISLREAFYAFSPEVAQITVFMICYVMTWMLVLPLRPGVQIFLVLLLISAPLFYFPELVHKSSASGVHVACRSLKLPLIGFATLGAFGLSLVCGLVTLLIVYLTWRFIYKGNLTRGKDIEVSLDDLSAENLTLENFFKLDN